MSDAARVRLRPQAVARARAGHLWVYRHDIDAIEGAYENGSAVDVLDDRGAPIGHGLINDRSHIVVRLWTKVGERIDGALLRSRLDAALELRRELHVDPRLSRIVNAEGDLLPGLIVDRYADRIVVQIQSLGLEPLRDEIRAWLAARFPEHHVFERSDTRARELEGLPARVGYWGESPPAGTEIEVASGEVRMAVDLEAGQKTGAYLDQRGNQARLAPLLAGRRMLDAFCNEGGFGLQALRAGAERVVFLDLSAPALARLVRNLERNDVASRADVVRMNAFDALRSFEKQEARFDAIVLDPPAFTKSKRQLDSAYRGYKEINLRALRLLRPHGLLFTASCSYHVSREMFRDMLRDAAKDSGRTVRIIEESSAGPDHPELSAMPETRYLKCVMAHVA